jgi:tetratricopeptide (TPR) repeat protein
MLTWATGYFNFEADLLPGPEEYTIKLSAHDLLLQGARRIDEWQDLESKLPSFETVLVRKENDQDLNLNELEENVLSLIDGNNSIDDVVKSSGLDFFEASKAIYVLLAAGAVEQPTRPAERKSLTGDMNEHRNIGLALYKTAKYDEAEREFKKVIDGDSENVEALFFLGLIEMMRYHDEKAKEYFEDALSKERRLSLLINIGYLCSRMGQYEDALAYLKEARELDPRNLKMLLNLGIIYYRKGDLEEAAKVFDECLEHSDETVTPYLYISTISMLKDDTEKAIDCLKRAISKFPRLTAFKNNLALLYESFGQHDDAEKLYRQVVFAQPEEVISIRNLANLYYRLGFYGAARKYYEQLPQNTRDSSVFGSLGRIRLYQGDRDAALDLWEQAHALNPDDDAIARDLEALRSVVEQ